ncbi:dinuclear metal center YbgI/SA1388 family protein [Laceyella sediminis]|uniref:GTP cyclohydrolase 1 type 2 homolog n=1 Tax=Laceyella sediminis TaxID=573074 RepID=A0ABX5ET08_9BACL|nr:Nif3-like dinuclear metal center hexameric protein [Laceyella sediminis]PRZ17106.1 dinuclear metal center YbgI/SA1388 family protein [Laceyella sediminis]
MPIKGKQLIQVLEAFAPPSLAVEKDRIGLQVGNPDSEVTGVLVTLDVNEEVVEEAIRQKANWIVAHHAVIFQPLKALRSDQPAGRLFHKLLKHDMNVYIAHTNLDAAAGGVNDVMAEKLGLGAVNVLIGYREDKLKKLVVFVPESHHEAVLDAICEAGAGWIGNYSHCSFQVEGTGTFMPREGTNPYIGQRGTLERINESRIETVVPESKLAQVLAAMLDAHPYEEVAYDVYPLELQGKKRGYGRIGELPAALTLRDFAAQVKQAYGVEGLRVVGDLDHKVKRVALVGGSGSRHIEDAKRAGADVYITGDVDFHTAQDALAMGLSIIDPGHHVEHHVVPRVCDVLKRGLGEQVPIMASTVNTNPFRFL